MNATPDIHQLVQDAYADAARCAAGGDAGSGLATGLYDEADRASLPEGALTAALGCANPVALADLRAGETVLDLGSGGGIDVLLSARRVGPTGLVYGLDMTPQMVELAARNAAASGVVNVRFLEGRIERVPLPDASVDVVLSNCVVNLSPDKPTVLAEAHRVLRPGGRLAIADLATRGPLPEAIRASLTAWAGCIAGTLDITELDGMLTAAGFADHGIEVVRSFGRDDLAMISSSSLSGLALDRIPADQLAAAEGRLVSVFVRAGKERDR